ncbi:MAG: hypothetical protein HY238_23030 [Acidobacteria bacterium]|nr:hypothetical protein [Acidobacteriota bacterium]
MLPLLVILGATPSVSQKFVADDPVRTDPDNRNIPTPKPYKLTDYYDFIQNSFGSPGDRVRRTAVNINTLGEVPDSSWFTNRHGRRRMSLEELARGPDRGSGPQTPLKVLRAKTEGITPGLLVEDARGDRYLVKFDPPGHLDMATSADVIGAKFLYAMGYDVPENYIFYLLPEHCHLGRGAIVTDVLGKQRKMDTRDTQELLNRVARTADGRCRAIASKIVEGEPMGPFRYYGARPDDPNDVFPHEHRRELRGLRVFAAWLNHDDSRAINTLDMLVKENGRQFLRHHLIDFGSILGSGSEYEQKPRAGNEYMWEPGITFRRMLTFGLWDRGWILVRYPAFPSIGRIEADYFEPEKWKPEYPNPAFLNCLPEDAYWAARIVMSFTDEGIRAIVKTGRITDPRAEEYLIQTIIRRRDKAGRYWLTQISSVDNFRVDDAGLVHFEDLAVRYGFAKTPPGYEASWYLYDNQNNRRTPLGEAARDVLSPLTVPEQVRNGPEGAYFGFELRSRSEGTPQQPKAVHSYFRRKQGRLELVGVERDQ